MAKNRVLVVDDEPDVLMLTCTALEDAGYDVIRAKDVPNARKLLLSEIPDVIVTDIMMPEESGFSLIKFIRENSGIRNIPIIVTSVLDSESEIYQQGADAYLPKPFTPEELIKMVSDLVNREEIPKMVETARDLIRERNFDKAKEVLGQILAGAADDTYRAFASFLSWRNRQGAGQARRIRKSLQGCHPEQHAILARLQRIGKYLSHPRRYSTRACLLGKVASDQSGSERPERYRRPVAEGAD